MLDNTVDKWLGKFAYFSEEPNIIGLVTRVDIKRGDIYVFDKWIYPHYQDFNLGWVRILEDNNVK